MIRHAFLATSALCLAVGSAAAADLATRPIVPYAAPAPVFTWTGFYIGLNAGAFFNGGSTNGAAIPGATFTGATAPGGAAVFAAGSSSAFVFGNAQNNRRGGFTGGATLGYNFQSGPIVYGVEADFNYRDSDSAPKSLGLTTVPTAVGNPGVPFAILQGGSKGSDFFGTVRGRIGYGLPRALIFVTAGFSYGGGNGSNGSINYYNQGTIGGAALPANPTAIYTSTGSKSQFGYVIGGGVEYAFTSNITGKIEYDYLGNGKGGSSNLYRLSGFAGPGAAPPATSYFSGNRRADNFSRLISGVNYKF